MKRNIAAIAIMMLILDSCMVLNIHPSKNISLNKSSTNKTFFMDLDKVIIYMDSKDVLKISNEKAIGKITELTNLRDTINLLEIDSSLAYRYNNEYLIKLLKQGKVAIIKKSDNSEIKKIRREWTNIECNWGYGYFLSGDTTCFFLHYYKLCPF